jgi:hypothetical protein
LGSEEAELNGGSTIKLTNLESEGLAIVDAVTGEIADFEQPSQ